jgi:hypothetical protein
MFYCPLDCNRNAKSASVHGVSSNRNGIRNKFRVGADRRVRPERFGYLVVNANSASARGPAYIRTTVRNQRGINLWRCIDWNGDSSQIPRRGRPPCLPGTFRLSRGQRKFRVRPRRCVYPNNRSKPTRHQPVALHRSERRFVTNSA